MLINKNKIFISTKGETKSKPIKIESDFRNFYGVQTVGFAGKSSFRQGAGCSFFNY